MLTFLFWNINGKPLTKSVARLANRHNVDILTLAECNIPAGELLPALNSVESPNFHYAPKVVPNKIEIYVRFSRERIQRLRERENFNICRLQAPYRKEILLTTAHLPSKLHMNPADQFGLAIEIAREIRDVEREEGHRRTLLIGDLNMDPFESGMITANGFHAVMTRAIAAKGERKVQSVAFPYFYNPMWGTFRRCDENAAGNVLLSEVGI